MDRPRPWEQPRLHMGCCEVSAFIWFYLGVKERAGGKSEDHHKTLFGAEKETQRQ